MLWISLSCFHLLQDLYSLYVLNLATNKLEKLEKMLWGWEAEPIIYKQVVDKGHIVQANNR